MARIRVPIDEDIAAAARVVKDAEKRATPKAESIPKPKKKKNTPNTPVTASPLKWSKGLVYGGLCFMTVLCLGLIADDLHTRHEIRQITADPQAYVDKQNQALVAHIGLLTDLPTGEIPLVATVSDASQAKSQLNFLANAQNGDKVLQFTKANRLVLYRPSTDKVIATGSLNQSKP